MTIICYNVFHGEFTYSYLLNDNKKAKRKCHGGHRKVKYCYVLPYLIAGIDLQNKLPKNLPTSSRDMASAGVYLYKETI